MRQPLESLWPPGLHLLAQHKPQMQANYYRVHDKINETDLGRRAVKNLVSLKIEHVLPEKKSEKTVPLLWTVEETEELTNLCKTELETGLKEKVMSYLDKYQPPAPLTSQAESISTEYSPL